MKRHGLIVAVAVVLILLLAGGGAYYLKFQSSVQSQVETQLQRFFASPPAPITKASYQKLDVALATRGITIDGIVIERSEAPFVIKIGRVDASGVDTDTWQKVFDPASYKDGAPDLTFRKLAETVTVTDLEYDLGEQGHAAVAKTVVNGIKARQFTVRPEPALWAALDKRERAIAAASAFRFDKSTYQDVRFDGKKMVGVVRHGEVSDWSMDKIGSVAIDDADLKNPAGGQHMQWSHLEYRDIPVAAWLDYALTRKPPDDIMVLASIGGVKWTGLKFEGIHGPDSRFSLASFDLGKVDKRRLERFEMAGLTVDGPDTSVTIGAIEIKNLDWEQLLPLLKDKDKDWLAKLSHLSYSIDKFSIRDVGGASLERLGARLHEFAFSVSTDQASGKQSSTATVSGFDIDASKVHNPEAAGVLKALGYDKLSISMDSVGTGDMKAGTSSLDKFRIWAPQVGELNWTFALSDYKPLPKTDKPMTIDESLAPLLASRLQSLRLSWKDDSLTERLLKMAGMQSGATPEQVRDGLIEQIKAFGQQYAGDAAVGAALQAFVAFLQKPGALTIDAKPPQPPRFGEIGTLVGASAGPPDLPKLFDVLGVTVTAN